LAEETYKLKSYFLELLVINVYDMHGEDLQSREGFVKVMEMLSIWNFDIVWERYYTRQDIPSTILNKRPLLMDPANPLNNIALTVDKEIMPVIFQKAREQIEKLSNP